MAERVYIAGKITGESRISYLRKFASASINLKKAGYDVLNPAKMCDALPVMSHAEYMRLTSELLKMADYIFVIDGRDDSEGVEQEIIIAQKEGIHELIEKPNCVYEIKE